MLYGNVILNEDGVVEDYVSSIISVDALAEKYHVGKLKIRKILADHNVKRRKRGGQCLNKKYVVSDWKVEKYPLCEGYHYIAVAKNDAEFSTNDYMNNPGVLTTYISKKLGITVPTLYDRREYYKLTGNYWWEQFFDIVKIPNNKTKKCPYCDWETIDVENKSGALSEHLVNVHNIDPLKYVEENPDQTVFKNKRKEKNKKEHLSNPNNSVKCPICGKFFSKLTESHMSNIHNMTLAEFKKKYPDVDILSVEMRKQINESSKLGNLVVSKKRFVSKPEREIQAFLKERGVNFSANRQILIGKEIDILINDSKIGIEFDGLKFHTEFFGKKNHHYHLDKTKLCNEKGYGLIHIFEDEYMNHKDIVLSKIGHILHLDNDLPKVQGRKTEVREITSFEAKSFLGQYHIQGFSKSSVYIGGFHQGKLIAVMSFKNGNIKNPQWELTRFATDYHFNYQGVGSKLFTYFVRQYDPEVVVSFADRRWTINKYNNLYTHLKFQLKKETPPDYTYYNERVERYKRFHKMNFAKSKLIEKYGFPDTLTELEMAKSLGYDRIWNCGLFKYVWHKNKENVTDEVTEV